MKKFNTVEMVRKIWNKRIMTWQLLLKNKFGNQRHGNIKKIGSSPDLVDEM